MPVKKSLLLGGEMLFKHTALQLEQNTPKLSTSRESYVSCPVLSHPLCCEMGQWDGGLSRTARSFEYMLMAVRNYDIVLKIYSILVIKLQCENNHYL